MWWVFGILAVVYIISQGGLDFLGSMYGLDTSTEKYTQYTGRYNVDEPETPWMVEKTHIVKFFEYDIITETTTVGTSYNYRCAYNVIIKEDGVEVVKYPQQGYTELNLEGTYGHLKYSIMEDKHQPTALTGWECPGIMNLFEYNLAASDMFIEYTPNTGIYIKGDTITGKVTIENNWNPAKGELTVTYSVPTVLGTQTKTDTKTIDIPVGTSEVTWNIPSSEYGDIAITPKLLVYSQTNNIEGLNSKCEDKYNRYECDIGDQCAYDESPPRYDGVQWLNIEYCNYMKVGSLSGDTQYVTIVSEDYFILGEQIEQKTEIIENLSAELQHQIDIINQMEATVAQQAAYIDQLNLSIQEQGAIIRELELNLQEKIEMVNALSANNEEQAILIAQMKLSFQEQQDIILGLENTIEEDGQLISMLNLTIQEQAEIINNMQLSLDDIIALLKAMELSVNEEKRLISELDLTIEEEQDVIDGLNKWKLFGVPWWAILLIIIFFLGTIIPRRRYY